MQHKIIYIYDALCGWCYGFSPVMQQFQEKYAASMEFEVLSGGMIMGLRAGPIGEVAAYIAKAYPDVEQGTGIKFGEPFLHQILEPGTAIFSSEMPGIAMTVFRKHKPEQALAFAHTMQNALYRDGIELSVLENYRPMVLKFGLEPDSFLEEMGREENRYDTLMEFQTVANWGVDGFPTVLLKPAEEEQYYMIARGYTPLERLEAVMAKILPEMTV